MLEGFYRNLDMEDDTFLSHRFVGEGEDVDDFSASDSDEQDADKVGDDEIEADNVEGESQAIDNEVEAPRKQKFVNLSAVTDEDNYDKLPEQENEVFIAANAKKTFVMKWSTQPKEDRILNKRKLKNTLKNTPGPRRAANRAHDVLTAFKLFIDDQLLEKIVQYTNRSIQNFRAEINPDRKKHLHIDDVDIVDIRAFFGILYLRAAKRVNLQNMRTIWYHESSMELFDACMSLNRFQFISRFITFDDKPTRGERWVYDKYACFREFFEAVNINYAMGRHPSPHLAIDETLYPYRGAIGFKQYNPSKPAKYGLLIRSLCDAEVPYTYFSLPYAGKPNEVDGNEASNYYITGTDKYTKYLVNGFNVHNSIQGCNIAMDRYFTSVPLAQWAETMNFTITGTLRLGRVGIPKEMKTLDGREERSTKYVYADDNNDIMLVSYVDKKKSGLKNVVVLTTMHEDVKVTRDKRRKPQVHSLYDHTKGGVDVVDLISSNSSTRIKSKRWPLNALAFILDTVRTNSMTILKDNGISFTSFEFTYQLGKALVMPCIHRRYEKPNNGLKIPILQKIRRVLGLKEVQRRPDTPGNNEKGRCNDCAEALVGQDNYNYHHNRMNNKITTKCFCCHKFLCKVHNMNICETCQGKMVTMMENAGIQDIESMDAE